MNLQPLDEAIDRLIVARWTGTIEDVEAAALETARQARLAQLEARSSPEGIVSVNSPVPEPLCQHN